jgi:cyclophilin family peptidyl-prolyl cis-trans isomerase
MTARFKVRELLSRLPGLRRRRSPFSHPLAQVLEARVLPAGNVNVRISNNTVVITGDREDNEVSVIVEDGNLVVRGLNDTTINGEEDDFIVAEDSETFDGKLLVRLGTGNDTFAIGEDVEINGRVTVWDFFGNDQVSIDQASINGGLNIFMFYGNDSVRLNGTTISGLTNIFTGFGDDLIVLDDITTSGFFKIAAGPGDDGVDTDGNTFGGRFVTRLGAGADDANFDGDNVDEAWILRTKGGDDAVRATGMTIEGFTLLRSTGGDDNFLFEDTNEFTGRIIALLGRGEDNLEFSDDSEKTGGVTEIGIEGDETDDSIYTSRFDASTSGLLARADALRLSVDGALTVTINPIPGTTQSNGVLLTKNQQIVFSGTTHADAVVAIDNDGDGQFDDGSVIADNDGKFSFNVTLPTHAANPGAVKIAVRASFGGTTATADRRIDVIQGTVVRFATTLGNYDVELFNSAAAATVTNFLKYLNRYTDSIIHRSEKTGANQPFIIQGGGFVNPPDVVPIATDAPVANEFNSANANQRGTLAMALPNNNINGGTSQWFVNAGNNGQALDPGKYTVFGKVLGDGMTVVDSIHALTSFNLIGPTGETALANVPLRNYTPFTETLAGTASVTSGQKTVTGVGTNFLTDLRVGEAVKIGDVVGVVESIQNNSSFTLAIAATTTVTSGQVKTNALPAEASYITLNTVSTLTV